jgi:hypothetical protein
MGSGYKLRMPVTGCVIKLTATQCLIWQLIAAVTKSATATSDTSKLVSVNSVGF